MSPQRGGDPDGSSYLELDAVAIAQVNSTRHGSIGPSSVPLEVIINNPPSPQSSPSSTSYYLNSNDPDGSVATLNLTNNSTTRKIDNIMEEINEQENDNDEESEQKETMSVITGNGLINWECHLDLEHMVMFFELPHTYSTRLCKKMNTLVKIKPTIEYVINFAHSIIERDYRAHVLKEDATNTSSLSPIPESAPASEAFASAPIQITDTSPAAKKEKKMRSTTDSTAGSTLLKVDTLMERIQAGQEAQKNHNDVTVSAMQAIANAISNMNNASKVDKGFERLKIETSS